jgi:hypothetical protein
MTTDKRNDFLNQLAKIITVVFHPLLMPAYGMAIIFSAPTLFGYLPYNVLLPLSLLPFFLHRNIITSWTISERKERNIPLIITTLLYCATSYIVFKFPIPVFLKSYIFGTAFLSLIVTFINFWWKISLHAAGAGALIGLVLILSIKMLTPLDWYLIAVIVAGGLVLSARLKLNLHNPHQVWLGLFAGFFGLTFFMMLF